MPQLGITLYLRAKAFNISNIRIESISETLDSSTNTPYVTARKVAQIIGKIIWPIFAWETLLHLNLGVFINLFWGKHRGIRISIYFITTSKYYHLLPFWKRKIMTLNKIPSISCKSSITKVYSDQSNSIAGRYFEIKWEKDFVHKNFSSAEKCRSSTWRNLDAHFHNL